MPFTDRTHNAHSLTIKSSLKIECALCTQSVKGMILLSHLTFEGNRSIVKEAKENVP